MCRTDTPAGADQALGSAAQKAAGEAQAQSMSTRGFISPGIDSNTPDTINTTPVAGVPIRLRCLITCKSVWNSPSQAAKQASETLTSAAHS